MGTRQRRMAFRFALVMICAVAIGTYTSPVVAADFDMAKLELLRPKLQEYVEKNVVAGAVAAVGTHRGLVGMVAVGHQNREQNLPMLPNATFRIASMTKPITALAIMILVDEGKVAVEDPVEKYLPEFKGQMIVASRDKETVTLKKPTRPITVRDLLTHTSGLPGGFPEGIGDLYFRRQLTLGEAVAVSSQRPLDFEPGTKWAYCNAGIDTLGRIVEVVSRDSFEAFLQKRVFWPTGNARHDILPGRRAAGSTGWIVRIEGRTASTRRVSIARANKGSATSHSGWRALFDRRGPGQTVPGHAAARCHRRIENCFRKERGRDDSKSHGRACCRVYSQCWHGIRVAGHSTAGRSTCHAFVRFVRTRRGIWNARLD